MILRNLKSGPADAAAAEAFLEVDALALSSVDLWERHGVELNPFALRDVAEAVEALAAALGESAPRERLGAMIGELETPFPCYLGTQSAGGEPGIFLTDGTRCRWSAFFDGGGAATIVTRERGKFAVKQRRFGARTRPPYPGKLVRLRQMLPWRRRGEPQDRPGEES